MAGTSPVSYKHNFLFFALTVFEIVLYFSLYEAVSQREGGRTEIKYVKEKTLSKQPPPALTAKTIHPCPSYPN